jgi:hypothetical protein
LLELAACLPETRASVPSEQVPVVLSEFGLFKVNELVLSAGIGSTASFNRAKKLLLAGSFYY